MLRRLEAPARLIAENSAVDAGVVVARMLAEPGNVGFDASANCYVDMYEAGIIDSTGWCALPSKMPYRWPAFCC